MITVIVKYKPAKTYAREEIATMLKAGAEHMFKGMPHLLSKQFCFDVNTNEGLSVYLWDSRASAEAFFTPEFLEGFEQSMGAVPSVEYCDTVVVVDNRAGEVLES